MSGVSAANDDDDVIALSNFCYFYEATTLLLLLWRLLLLLMAESDGEDADCLLCTRLASVVYSGAGYVTYGRIDRSTRPLLLRIVVQRRSECGSIFSRACMDDDAVITTGGGGVGVDYSLLARGRLPPSDLLLLGAVLIAGHFALARYSI